MPIIIRDDLPACHVLAEENVFVINNKDAQRQDIRALKIAILNLMPNKIETEVQLLRLLGNSSLQIEVELIQTSTHDAKNSSKEYLTKFYKTFEQIKDNKFDGLIVTGAPVEKLDFEQVDYWPELCEILEWSKTNVYSVLHICWGAQAGLYYHYGIPKYLLSKKVFGVYKQICQNKTHTLLRGFDDVFFVPQSRYTEIKSEDIEQVPQLEILAESDEAGVNIVANRSGRQVFITGHFEYDLLTLNNEYQRDRDKGIKIQLPHNYYPFNNAHNMPAHKWRAHANLLFSNWLNYYVYQETPYYLNQSF